MRRKPRSPYPLWCHRLWARSWWWMLPTMAAAALLMVKAVRSVDTEWWEAWRLGAGEDAADVTPMETPRYNDGKGPFRLRDSTM